MRFLLIAFCLLLWAACTQPQSSPSGDKTLTSRQSYLEARSDLAAQTDQALEVDPALADLYRSKRDSLLLAYRREKRFPLQGGFFGVKDEIGQNSLFRMLEEMPKGGLLHVHDLALGSAWLMVDMALSLPNCYVYWGEDSPQFIKGQIHFYKPGDAPGGFMEAKKLQQLSPRFRAELYDLLTFDDQDVRQAKDIWVPFEEQFRRRLGFMHYRPAMIPYFVAAFDSLAQRGIQHVEIRSILSDGLYDLDHPRDHYNIDSMVTAFEEALALTRQKHPEFSLKIIHTGIRILPPKVVHADLAMGYRLRRDHPESIVGYDLVGQEDAGRPTLMHLDCCWLKQDSLEAVYGVSLPLFLHDGESNWPGNDNLYDAVLLDVRRIGHGLNLFRYPQVEERVRQQQICVEVSPLSNMILGYVPDIRNHPGAGYFRRGVPVALSNDDPSIFGYHGTTYDFWVAAVAWGFDLAELKALARNSLEFSALEGAEKSRALAAWEQAWEAWAKKQLNGRGQNALR